VFERATAAARDARWIVEERSHAYTFHADPGFSFGKDVRICLLPKWHERSTMSWPNRVRVWQS